MNGYFIVEVKKTGCSKYPYINIANKERRGWKKNRKIVQELFAYLGLGSRWISHRHTFIMIKTPF